MNYYDKILNLWTKMKEDKEYFDNADEAKEYLFKLLSSFSEYIDKTVKMEMVLPLRKEYIDEYIKADETRHNAHEKAIRSISQLNVLSETYGLPIFADVDTKDRLKVADFCKEYTFEMFNNRKL